MKEIRELTTPRTTKVQRLKSEYTANNLSIGSESIAQERLWRNIGKHVFEDKLVKIESWANHNGTFGFRMTLDALPINSYEFEHIIVEEHKLKYQDVELSEEQIIKCIKNYYPEKFI